MSESATQSNGTVPPSPEKTLPEEIQSKLAKMKALQLLQAGNRFHRDSDRLDKLARAVRKKQGFDLEEKKGDFNMVADDIEMDEASAEELLQKAGDDEMGDINLIADNIKIGQGSSGSGGNGGSVDNEENGGNGGTVPPPPVDPGTPVVQPDPGTTTTPPEEKSTATKIAPFLIPLALVGGYYLGGKDTNTDTRLELGIEGGRPVHIDSKGPTDESE